MRCNYPKHWDACADPIWFLSEFLLPCQRVLYLVMGNLMKQPLNWDSVPLIHISTATSCIEWIVFRLCVKHLKWPHLIGTWPILCKNWFAKNRSSKLFVTFTQPPGHVQRRFGWSHPFHQWKIGGSCWRFLLSMQGAFPGNEAAAETWKKTNPSIKASTEPSLARTNWNSTRRHEFLRVQSHYCFWCSCVWESQTFYFDLFFLNMQQNHNFISKKQGGDTHVMKVWLKIVVSQMMTIEEALWLQGLLLDNLY